MNPNFEQGLEDEQAGMNQEIEDIDYDSVYGGLDVDLSDSNENIEPTSLEKTADYGKQFGKGLLIGAGGTWGDLAELAGLNTKVSEADNAKNFRDYETLDRIQKSGKPTWEDIVNLEGDDASPSFKLPTTDDLESANAALGGPSENPETTAGKFGKRQGRLVGGGAVLGAQGLVGGVAAPIVAATAGQTVEELGGGPLAQGAAEIATLLLTQGRGSGKTLVSSAKKEVQDKINKLRQLGYTEQDITLAINSASKGKVGPISASKGTKTEQAFENFAEHSQDIISDILTSEIPGISGGTQNVHRIASNAYGQVVQQASNITIKNPVPFINSATRVVRELRKNLGRNPESESFINRLADAVVDSTQQPSAENFMNFYKELNKAGNWMNRNQKDRLLTQVKDGIKETFRAEGKAGQKLAQDFETVNEGIQKAYRAEEVHDFLQKSLTQDGYDYKKMFKIFDNPDNVQVFEQVLGARQADNINMIARTGKEIKDFDKAWKATNSSTAKSDLLKTGGAAYYLFKGDLSGLTAAIAAKGTNSVAKKIAEKFLTDPKLQNITIRGMHAVKNESPKALKSANESLKRYFDEEGLDID